LEVQSEDYSGFTSKIPEKKQRRRRGIVQGKGKRRSWNHIGVLETKG